MLNAEQKEWVVVTMVKMVQDPKGIDGEVTSWGVEKERPKRTTPRIPTWSPTVVLTGPDDA